MVKHQEINVFKITSLCLVLLFLGLISASITHAETYNGDSPSYYSGNGHYYMAVSALPEGITWTDAKAEAESFTYLGMSGHLATITSQGENDFIYSLKPGDYWLGAFQPDGSQEPDGGWQWVTGEPWDYTNWHLGEPNNYDDAEDALQLYGSAWNDYTHYYTADGYVVEYEPNNNTPVLPVANFSSNVTKGYAPLTVQFTDTSKGTPTSWIWNFGDGNSSTEQNPVHTYSKVGKYTVSLTVENSDGNNSTSKVNYINVVTPTVPSASFSASPTYGKAPLTVTFTDKSTNLPTSWNWNFGDGSVSTEQNPSHTYEKAGQYTVKLKVKNAAGSSAASKSNYIIVTNSLKPPNAAFSASPTYGKAPLTVTFTDKSTNSPESWNWNLGDGSVSTEQNPSHTYSKPGQYTVKLKVKNAAGSSSASKSNYIIVTNSLKPPTASFSASPISGKAPLTVTFTDKSTNSPESWKWSFGDGNSSTDQNPVHTYSNAGQYTVKLKVKNEAGSSTKTMSGYITVSKK